MAAFFSFRPSLQSLADRYRQGETHVLGELWQGLFKRGIRFLLGRKYSKEEAYDLIQDKIEDIVARLHRGQHIVNVEAYLLKALDNALKRSGAGQKKEIPLSGEGEEALEPVTGWQQETKKAAQELWAEQEHEAAKERHLRWALSQLGERCADILRYAYWADCGMADLAEELALGSTDSAKTRKSQCLDRLRRIYFANHSQV